jgi:hypothetical protein
MAYDYEPGKGKMWRNDSNHPKAPLWSGAVKIPEGSEGKTMQIAAWYNEAYTNKGGHNVKENLGLTITEPWEGESKSDFKPEYHKAPSDNGATPRSTEGDNIPF